MARYLLIRRKGYYRRPYVRRGGIHVRGTRVPPTTYRRRDIGAVGRGRRVIRIRHPGRLAAVGYNVKAPVESRRAALRRAVERYGERSTMGMLHAQAIFRKRTDSLGERFAADRTWVAKTFGTYRGRR
jgi:isopropylmalate/homocitrate/citramalate synthase